MKELLFVVAAVAVLAGLALVAVLILTLCGELLAHWREEDF